MAAAQTEFAVPDFDLTDDELRRAGTIKWSYPAPDVLPAWVAEMDVRPPLAVREALHEAIESGALGYPPNEGSSELPEATSEFMAGRFGWAVDPVRVVVCGDVMAGVIIVLRVLCEQAPVIVPVPSYPPFLAAVATSGKPLVTVPLTEDGSGRAVLDVERIEAELAAGARTVLLASPYNPLGRVFSPAELEALRDAVNRHGARVIADEIHSPLVLPGARHQPYAALPGTAHATTIFAATKAWNFPGLKCAQIIPGTAHDLAALRGTPPVLNHGTSPLGVLASVAAYRHGLAWLDGLVGQLDARRSQLAALLAQHLPQVSWRSPEGTYLTWLDARATGLPDPAGTALARGRVMVNPGRNFTVADDSRYDGFVRLNLATSAERLDRIVRRLADAWGEGSGGAGSAG